MKKEYEKPYINTVEIKGNENIAEETTSALLNKITAQDGTTNAYGKINYNLLKY